MDPLASTEENRERIQAVDNSFGPSVKSLATPGRALIGEGRLMKLSRRRPQPKAFFLFNDVLVYGSILLHGRWHANRQIIPLEDVLQEDLDDSPLMKNQWLIRTPRKSFYVAAVSPEEKRAWMDHIEDRRSRWLASGAGRRPSATFAVTWVPDRASAVCMRCTDKFSAAQRRHHCRSCGFVVCGSCSKRRALLAHIHATKLLRVCGLCYAQPGVPCQEETRSSSPGTRHSEGNSVENSEGNSVGNSEEELVYSPSRWLDTQEETYTYST